MMPLHDQGFLGCSLQKETKFSGGLLTDIFDISPEGHFSYSAILLIKIITHCFKHRSVSAF